MTGYADPEHLIGDWLKAHLEVKVWKDPNPPSNRWATAPWLWVQRAPAGETLALTLDAVLLDLDAYAADADHARDLGQRAWSAMTFDLPLLTFSNGVFVKSSTCSTRPFWGPDPQYRRSATYRVILHGLVA